MKRKHRKRQKHYSGKELLKRRKFEREEYEKLLNERKLKSKAFSPLMCHSRLPFGYKITLL